MSITTTWHIFVQKKPSWLPYGTLGECMTSYKYRKVLDKKIHLIPKVLYIFGNLRQNPVEWRWPKPSWLPLGISWGMRQCWWLSGSAASYLAVLPAIWQLCQLSGNAVSYLTAASYLAILPAIWQCCRLSGNAAGYLAMLPDIWQCFWLFYKGWPPRIIVFFIL